MRKILLILSMVVFIPSLSAKPSWCKDAHTYVEKKICQNRDLIDLDYEESAIYIRIREFLKENDKKLYEMFLKDEEAWVRERDTDCYKMPNSCIKNKYQERIDYLHSIIRGNRSR